MSMRPTDPVEEEVWNVDDYTYLLPYVAHKTIELITLLNQLAAQAIPARATNTQVMALDDLWQELDTCCQTVQAALGMPTEE